MKELRSLWKETKNECHRLETSLIDCRVAFLREVTKRYLAQGRRVFFRENRVVHWGEDNFGELIIEGHEEVTGIFGEHISEIRFEPEISEKLTRAYTEITGTCLENIKYEL